MHQVSLHITMLDDFGREQLLPRLLASISGMDFEFSQ